MPTLDILPIVHEIGILVCYCLIGVNRRMWKIYRNIGHKAAGTKVI